MTVKRIVRILAVLTVLLCLPLAGCQEKKEEAKAKVYTNKGGTYKVSFPGEWKVSETNNDDHMVLDRTDGSMSILVQRFPKEGVDEEDGSGLEEFVRMYHEQAVPDLVQTGAVGKGTIRIDGMKGGKTEEYTVEEDKQKYNAFITYLESDLSFYSIVITGNEKRYGDTIEKLKEALQTFREISTK